jgi:ABC-type oligopeptide transport system substrate-binding subunit
LVDYLLAENRWEEGITYSQKLLRMEPLDESAHRKLMRLLYFSDQRSAALVHYEHCRDLLKDELGVEPEEQTETIYQEILSGILPAPSRERAQISKPASRTPPFLDGDLPATTARQPVFVARENELSALHESLDCLSERAGGLTLITGGAGRGKTALMNAFASRASHLFPGLLVVNGSCNALSGMSDPYLPFREILNMLTGELEPHWRSGGITHEQTLRLWNALPEVVRALLDFCPNLIGSFINKERLLSYQPYVESGRNGWVDRLKSIPDKQDGEEPSEPSNLHQGFTTFLQHVSNSFPLLIFLDDMQWADSASIDLFFHLGRRLSGYPILVVCAYRPDEIASGRDGARHPLEKVLGEFKRLYGDIWIDLGKIGDAEDRQFIDEYLDACPNKFGGEFRGSLYEHTRGHPLFTIELLREMQDREHIVQHEGLWQEGTALDWELLPPKIEGIIEERISRLDKELEELLRVASVEGEQFTSQVVARVQNLEERTVEKWLSKELGRKHRLVREIGLIQVGDLYLNRYEFTHTMFHTYIYENMGERERMLLHNDVGESLEILYRGNTSQIAVQLARHFQQARKPELALPYLIQAGDSARALYALQEAENYYQQACQIQLKAGYVEKAARTYLKLGLVYTASFEPQKAQESYQQAFRLWEPLGDSPELLPRIQPLATLRIAIEEPRTLDPGKAEDDVSAFMVSQIFEGLVRIGQDYNVLPAAADRWDVDNDGSRYTFHLKEGALWNDDSYVRAADFVNAWKRNLRSDEETAAASLLYAIKNGRAFRENRLEDPGQFGVRALDDFLLEVELEEPTPYLPYLLAHPIFYPLPLWMESIHGDRWALPENIITNGPYEITGAKAGEWITLEKNPLYRADRGGNVQRVDILTFETIWTALEIYQAGDLDALSLFNADPATIIQAMNANPDEIVPIPRPSTLYLSFRSDITPFDDVLVRRAFIHAVDRSELARSASQGLYAEASGGFVPPGMVGHTPGIGLEFNPDLARRYLSEAGYPGGKGFPQITWLQPTASRENRIVPFLQSAWRKNLGLELVTESLEWPEYYQRFTSDPAQLMTVGWSADYPDPDNMLRVTFHSSEGLNVPRWSNSQFDTLVESAKRITDHTNRMHLYSQADRILVAEQAVIMPLGYSSGWMLAKPWIRLPGERSLQMPFSRFIVEREWR